VPYTANLDLKRCIGFLARRSPLGIHAACFILVIRRGGDLQGAAGRLDSQDIPMLIDEHNGHFCRWSSSAFAFQALELFPLSCCQAFSLPSVSLGLSDSTPERFGDTSDLLGNGADDRPLCLVIFGLLDYEPYRPLPDFRQKHVFLSRNHIISRSLVSGKLAAIQVQRRAENIVLQAQRA
jgi:hypothetical protein